MGHLLRIFVIVVLLDTITSGPISTNLVHLGLNGSKWFAADTTEWRDWTAAKSFCSSIEMKLATVTPSNAVFLKTKYNASRFDGSYWLNGRDKQTSDQFIWDEEIDDVFPDDSNFINQTQVEYQTCVVFKVTDDVKTSGFAFWPCAKPLGTLCMATGENLLLQLSSSE